MAPGMLVQVRGRWPHQARILEWGKAADGWWGLVAWEQPIRVKGRLERILYSAWIPAAQLSKPGWAKHRKLRIRQLPVDHSEWPQPSYWEWEGHFIGAWPAGDVPAPADGVKVVTSQRSPDADPYAP